MHLDHYVSEARGKGDAEIREIPWKSGKTPQMLSLPLAIPLPSTHTELLLPPLHL
jgi:hypothetical protein